MHTPVPNPSAIVHDVALFLLNPPHLDAAGRAEWERARDAIAKLASEPCASVTPEPPPCPETKNLGHGLKPHSNVVRLFPRKTRDWS